MSQELLKLLLIERALWFVCFCYCWRCCLFDDDDDDDDNGDSGGSGDDNNDDDDVIG